MKIPNSGIRIDDPSYPLLQGLVSYWGVSTANGSALGTTLVCADLANQPSYDGLTLKILTGPSAGQGRTIQVHAGNTLTVGVAFQNPAGAVQQITAGTLFVILSTIGGGGGPGPAPTEGLSYYGVVDAVPGANQFTIGALAGLGAGKFDGVTNPYFAFVLRDAGGAAAAPQGEQQPITAYDTATGTFTTTAFTAAVGVGDEILIVSPYLAAMGILYGERSGALAYMAQCPVGMAASTNTIVCPNLGYFPNDTFNNSYQMIVIRNVNALGVAPEMEMRRITDFVTGSGTFTTEAFSANVEENDIVLIIHNSVAAQISTFGIADAGSGVGIVRDAARTEADDWWNGQTVMMLSGAARGQKRPIADFIAATDDIIPAPNFDAAVAAGDLYVILAHYNMIVPRVADSADNALTSDVVGRKDDTPAGNSIVSGIKASLDGVWLDTVNGQAGTDYPIGTPGRPVNNLADALTILAARNCSRLYLLGTGVITFTADANLEIIGNEEVQINVAAGINLTIRKSFECNGMVINTGATLVISGNIKTKGSIDPDGATVTIWGNAQIQDIVITGASNIVIHGNLQVETLSVLNTSNLTVMGDCSINDGSLNNNGTGTCLIEGRVYVSGSVINNGGGVVNIYGDAHVNAVNNTSGIVRFRRLLVRVGNIANTTGSIYVYGDCLAYADISTTSGRIYIYGNVQANSLTLSSDGGAINIYGDFFGLGAAGSGINAAGGGGGSTTVIWGSCETTSITLGVSAGLYIKRNCKVKDVSVNALGAMDIGGIATIWGTLSGAPTYRAEGQTSCTAKKVTNPVATGNLFTIANGLVRVRSIVGHITTGIEVKANATKLVHTPTGGAPVDLCATLDVSGATIRKLLSIDGVKADALILSADEGVVVAASLMGDGIVLAPGVISLNCADSSAGQVEWYINYEPLGLGARIY
jgi:hypothetical protein